MKNIKKACFPLLIIAALSFAACKSSPQQQDTSDTTNSKQNVKRGKISKRTQDGCYIKASGQQMKDTLYVQLHIQNNKVSGRMIESIFEKDSRKGTLEGTLQPDKSIKAVWTFMQEGMTDTLAVDFRLDHTGITQKPYKVNTSTGRQVTDATAPYSIKLEPADCNK